MSASGETCVVCLKAILPGDALAGGGRDPVHATCDRRTRWRLDEGAACAVCARPIHSADGVARLGNVLVHGACYVRARKPDQGVPPPEAPAAPASRITFARRLALRFFRRSVPQGR
jgi:hypothetical protein